MFLNDEENRMLNGEMGIVPQKCMEYLRDEGEAYGQRLGEAGNEVEIHRMEDGLHGYFSLPARFELVKKSYDIINQFLEG